MFQEDIFRRSRGRVPEAFFWGQAPRPPSFCLSSSTTILRCIMQYIVGLLVSSFRGVGGFWHIGEFISAIIYTWDQYNLVSKMFYLAKTLLYPTQERRHRGGGVGGTQHFFIKYRLSLFLLELIPDPSDQPSTLKVISMSQLRSRNLRSAISSVPGQKPVTPSQ